MVDPQNRTIYGYVTGTVFLVISIGLLLQTYKLLKTLKRHYSELQDEQRQIRVLFVVFTFSYFVRTVLFFT
jgi:hypothetical protein